MEIKLHLKGTCRSSHQAFRITSQVTDDELSATVNSNQCRKGAGVDNIYLNSLNILTVNPKMTSHFYNNVIKSLRLKPFKRTNIIAVAK